MGRNISQLLLLITLVIPGAIPVAGQKQDPARTHAKAAVYYFHPAERCPIDQSIEETTRKLVKTEFAREIREGTLDFRVINTDDKANARIVSGFEMNAQALYVVRRRVSKEEKTDLTEMAFSTCQTNPARFKSELKQAILKALK